MAGEMLNYLDSVESFVELVGDVKFVCVEEKNDSVDSLGKPSENLKLDLKRKVMKGSCYLRKVISSIDTLFFTG
jgi:hypothetical protein